MALLHRKLLFSLSDQKSYPPCYMCYLCPDECYSFPSPPLPPPPSPEQKQRMSTILIIMLCILGGALLFLSYFTIIRFRSKLRRDALLRNPMATPDIGRNFIDENQGPVVDHPIWHIRTIGYPQSVIDSISIYKYAKGEGLVEGIDCSICLSEFRENENLRLLPKCSHAFHVPCIDKWLRSQKNCPVCRAPILSNPTLSNVTVSTIEIGTGSSQSEQPQMLNHPETDADESRGIRESTANSILIQENRDKQKQGDDLPLKNKWVFSVNFRVLSDLTDQNRRNSFPVRRSASMDNFPSASVVHHEKQKEEEESCSN